MNIIFLGAPGSGKGTQAAMLAKEMNIPTISTGAVLRHEVSQQSEIGKRAKSYMESGQLVPDEVVVGIIRNRIVESDCQEGFILDGFPRNIAQAEILDEMLFSLKKKIEIVIDFDVNEDILVKRISGRFSCKGCGSVYNTHFKNPNKKGVCDDCGSSEFESRSDDNEATVKSRLDVYRESTFELIEFYKKNNLLLSIEAVQTAPLVFQEVIKAVRKFSN